MGDTFDVSHYLGVFIEEAKEHIESLEENLVKLEKEPYNQDLIQAIFRSFHTIKGSSGSMGFQQMTELAHLLENLLDRVRRGEVSVSSSLIDLLLQGLDFLKRMLEEITKKGQEPDWNMEEIFSALQDFRGEKEKDDSGEYWLTVKLASDCSMKGVRAYLVISRLQDSGIEVVNTVPSLSDLEGENFGQSFDILVRTALPPEEVAKIVGSVAEIERVEVKEGEEEEKNRIEEKEEKNTIPPTGEQKITTNLKKTVRVDVERLDSLLNLVGELVIDRTRLEDIIQRLKDYQELVQFREILSDTTTHIGRVTNDLQMEIMKARMLPLAEVFNRFPRLIRDLARQSGKEIDFIIEGEETELDRSLLEEITDPLIHLLRNAVDHGIESREERINKGKPPQGKVILRAYQEENSVVIVVEDDGRGLDVEKIKDKVVGMGLVTPEEVSKMSEREIVDFIFYPGFSTSDEVTEVSGRGVGMDVVKRNIERVNGQVRVESQLGVGTTFYLRLPLTLAIIRALLVKVGESIYSIPLSDVVEIEKVEKKDTYWVNRVLTTLFRGKTLPLLWLEALLDSRKYNFISEDEIPEVLYTVVVSASSSLAGLVVDEVLGEQEIVIKSLGSYMRDVRGLGGATILGDGGISLIIDVASLLWKFSRAGG
ncbi:Hpt domain-containing protein [Candidatus Sordicultor fermentans]|uniref:Hpt domain-containing protein n=1 Tax=Candidatus Sordicultor fermentans TaxID=1953203 RepID=UPI0016B5D758|nr:chemotaxis protein CheA [Candidatus Atribacteria bacterium]